MIIHMDGKEYKHCNRGRKALSAGITARVGQLWKTVTGSLKGFGPNHVNKCNQGSEIVAIFLSVMLHGGLY